ncbi:hypothetical protein DPMN_148299 [Dreissena polymorpha]|uniref:Uncharacterized protein n=1 Tax=Dreissena polymorpha TaxID=45954 RepID=A0A9D4FBG7_DREPO|nr:hypothetical protein DPMN_148299 [Dreissena polymorpha]
MLVGLARFVGEYSFKAPVCGEEDTRPGIIKNFHYLYFSIFLFVVTGMVATIVTMATKPINRRCLYRLTFWMRHSKKPRLDIDSMHAKYSSSSSETSSESNEREMQVLKQTEESGDVPQKLDGNEGVDVIVDDSDHNTKHDISCCRRMLNWTCGLENVDKTHINKLKVQRVDMVDIAEKPR